jgi:hypothetical protein
MVKRRGNNRAARRAAGLKGGYGGESIALVCGTYAHFFTTIITASPQLVFTPTNISSGALGGRLQDFTNLYERMRFKSLKVTGLGDANTGILAESVVFGFVAGGVGNTTAPNIVSLEQMSQLSRFRMAMPGQTVPVTLSLSARELNPVGDGWFDVDGGFQWYLYVGAVAYTGLLVASDQPLLFEYEMEFTGAVDPSVFQQRVADRAAQKELEADGGYVQVGNGPVVPIASPAARAPIPSRARQAPTKGVTS